VLGAGYVSVGFADVAEERVLVSLLLEKLALSLKAAVKVHFAHSINSTNNKLVNMSANKQIGLLSE